jgi:hypothetical protein
MANELFEACGVSSAPHPSFSADAT